MSAGKNYNCRFVFVIDSVIIIIIIILFIRSGSESQRDSS
jgi:hypothetical protein